MNFIYTSDRFRPLNVGERQQERRVVKMHRRQLEMRSLFQKLLQKSAAVVTVTSICVESLTGKATVTKEGRT